MTTLTQPKMSWLARSIANSLKLDDDDYEEGHSPMSNTTTAPNQDRNQNQSTADSPRGVKEDLTELTKSFSRQLWGVASFLAPPPEPQEHQTQIRDQRQQSDESDQQPQISDRHDPEVSDEALIEGIKSDFAEIGGKFKTGISKLSNNISVSEITKMASNFLQFGSEADPIDAVGVTEEVLMFARNISLHPETWIDFPVPDDDDFDDFDMSDAQQEHALAVERLTPTLAALRMELCPGYMSESCFWKIYFVLLRPRLRKEDAEILSTPQILEARAMLAQDLQNRAKSKPEPVNSEVPSGSYKTDESGASCLGETAELPEKDCHTVPCPVQSESVQKSATDGDPYIVAIDFETDKHPVQSTEVQVVDKTVVKEETVDLAKHQYSLSGSSVGVEEKFEDDGDDWLKEESSETVGMSGSKMHLENDEDVSFSDLEEEDGDVPISYKKVTSGSDSSAKDSRDWVQLSRSSSDAVKDIKSVGVNPTAAHQGSPRNPESKESNDWLDVDDIDEM